MVWLVRWPASPSHPLVGPHRGIASLLQSELGVFVATWPEAFSLVAGGTVSRYDELMSYVPLSLFVAGPVLSGLAGGLVAYLVLVRPMRSAS